MTRRLDIVGAGVVGRTLGRLLHQAGAVEIGGVVNRSLQSAREAVDFIGAGRAGVRIEDPNHLDLVMLSVSDDQVEAAAAALANAAPSLEGVTVFHCSGALSSESLAAVAAVGARTASLHPVKTFADAEVAVAGFAGTHCGLEGDAAALADLRPLVEAIGGRGFEIDSRFKTLYHAGSVFACNYLTALLEVALRCEERAGLSREVASALLEPLVVETVRNSFALGPAAALTGPIARGDAGVVRRQLAAVGEVSEDTASLYALLGRVAAELARAGSRADSAALESIEAALAEFRSASIGAASPPAARS